MNTVKKLTLSAIFSAIILIVLFIGAYIKTGTLAIYALSTFFIMALICETGIKYGILSYAAVSLLAFMFVPDKYIVSAFTLVFGLYAVLKCIIEKINSVVPEWICKLLFFNAALCGIYFIITIFTVDLKISLPLLWIGANIFLTAYDIILSFCISYYKKNISPKLHLKS